MRVRLEGKGAASDHAKRSMHSRRKSCASTPRSSAQLSMRSVGPRLAPAARMVGTTTLSGGPAAARTPAPRSAALASTRTRKRRARLAIWCVTAAVVAIGGWRLAIARRAPPVPVQVVRVEEGSVRDFVTSVSAGRISARQEATLRSEIGGVVRTLHHRRGDKVQAGEPLISYDSVELGERLRAAQAAVRLARAQVLQLDQNVALAEATSARASRLHAVGSLPEAEVEAATTQARALARGADAARASVQQAEANVEIARMALGKGIVRAPFTRTILSTAIEVGETSLPGTPLLSIADVSELHVDVDIDEADVGRLALGADADVTLDSFPGERLRGTLRMIAPSVTRDAHGGRSVGSEISLPSDPRLRVGMSADVDVIVAVHHRVRWLPPNAILGRGAERSVYVVSDGIVHKRAVGVGIATWEAVEVTSGLTSGEQVVASLSSTRLADGARVVVRDLVQRAAK